MPSGLKPSAMHFLLKISALLNFATKASSPLQTDQRIHKAPENILHIQRGPGEILLLLLLYNLPFNVLLGKNGSELLSSDPACLVQGLGVLEPQCELSSYTRKGK